MRILPLLLFIAVPVHATDDSPLRAFDFLAGNCWQGTYANGSVDTHCYEWVYDGEHLRDVHVVRGKGPAYCGETLYSIDGAAEGVVFYYVNSLGGVSEGRMVVEDGVLLSPGETYVDKEGKVREFRSSLRPLDASRYEARTEERVDGKWV
ncbi:MAG TPA: hypothetical protein VF275_08875, partial [Gammaproteobacteria bacterium]